MRRGQAIRAGYRRAVSRICEHPRRAALLLLMALVPATVLTVHFFSEIQAGFEELLPRHAPSVTALREIQARLGGRSHLTVIAHSGDPNVNRRFISELGDRVRALRLPLVSFVQSDIKVERQWIKDHSLLLIEEDKFASLMNEVDGAISRSKASLNPLYVDLGLDDVDSHPRDPWDPVVKWLDTETGARDRFPAGFLETPGGNTVVALIWLAASEVDYGPSAALYSTIRAEVERLRPRFPAHLSIAYTGDVPNVVEEHAAILADLSLSSLVVAVVVGLLMVLYFRSARSDLVVLMGIVPGLLFTFAIGRLTIGHLNSNTAFLGSIIAGNGINYPLMFLAYYRARSPSEPLVDAIVGAAAHALPGTLGAAATASAAYGGLAVSDFRGFSQFGWLGGIGMLTTWVFTFIAMPIAIALFRPPRQRSQSTSTQSLVRGYFARRRVPEIVAATLLLVTVGIGAVGAWRGAREGLYEMDIQVLRNRDSLRSGAASWDGKMNELFGSWINPVVALVESAQHRETAAGELRRALVTGEPPWTERVETFATYRLPEAEQAQRIARLQAIKRELDRLPADSIPARAKPYIDSWLAPENLQVLRDDDVPRQIRDRFAEKTGRVDRVVLLFPSIKINYNDGVNILAFVDRLGTARLPPDGIVGGAFLFMAEIMRLVRDQAPRVVLTVIALVGLALLPLFWRRPRRVALVVGTVVTVAVAAQLVMLAAGVKINMLNFAAVPITIGVGADYVVSLLGAMDAFKVNARGACARMGGAIFLCSLTTIVGYASLLLAQSGALRTFGMAAVLGEVMAVLAVLVILPVVLARRAAGSLG